jgi:hypothetical protein
MEPKMTERAPLTEKIETIQERNCDHHFTGNDCLCKKCGLYFPETNDYGQQFAE